MTNPERKTKLNRCPKCGEQQVVFLDEVFRGRICGHTQPILPEEREGERERVKASDEPTGK